MLTILYCTKTHECQNEAWMVFLRPTADDTGADRDLLTHWSKTADAK